MNGKAGVVSLIISLFAICLVIGTGNAAARNQAIQSEVTGPVPVQTWGDDVITSQNSTPEDQEVMLRNPTFKELKEFILADPTSRNSFVINQYECRHFATDLNNNADAAGIRCAFVLLCYRSGQHAVVAFETTDRGKIYIEPQTDAAIQPVVGGRYQEQEIMEILVSW